jgi:hypothetical protein
MWCAEDTNTTVGNSLYDISTNHSLTQFIHEPTRITPTSKSCLDLLFSDSPGFISSVVVTPPIGGSDHSTHYTSIDMSLNNADVSRSKRIWYYDRTDFDAINNVIPGMKLQTWMMLI